MKAEIPTFIEGNYFIHLGFIKKNIFKGKYGFKHNLVVLFLFIYVLLLKIHLFDDYFVHISKIPANLHSVSIKDNPTGITTDISGKFIAITCEVNIYSLLKTSTINSSIFVTNSSSFDVRLIFCKWEC